MWWPKSSAARRPRPSRPGPHRWPAAAGRRLSLARIEEQIDARTRRPAPSTPPWRLCRDPERDLMELVALDGLSVPEAAAVLGVKPGHSPGPARTEAEPGSNSTPHPPRPGGPCHESRQPSSSPCSPSYASTSALAPSGAPSTARRRGYRAAGVTASLLPPRPPSSRSPPGRWSRSPQRGIRRRNGREQAASWSRSTRPPSDVDGLERAPRREGSQRPREPHPPGVRPAHCNSPAASGSMDPAWPARSGSPRSTAGCGSPSARAQVTSGAELAIIVSGSSANEVHSPVAVTWSGRLLTPHRFAKHRALRIDSIAWSACPSSLRTLPSPSATSRRPSPSSPTSA